MAEANPDTDYNRLEKEFINRTYESRLIQKAKEDGKLICPDCYSSDGTKKFYTLPGVDIHYRRVHYKQKAFDHVKSVKLFQELHFNESKLFIDQLSKHRAEYDANSNIFNEYVINSEHLQSNIYAKTKKEAVKLAGLVLMHGGFVQSLSKNGYQVIVVKKEDVCGFPEKFLVWKSCSKIYVESVYTREVNIL